MSVRTSTLVIDTSSSHAAPKEKTTDWLDSNRLLYITIGVCSILYAPVLFLQFYADDFLHLAIFAGNTPLPANNHYSPFGLFSFLDGDNARFAAVRDLSMVPWWTTEAFQFSFWRPISEWTHYLDYTIAGKDSAHVAHLQSLLWYFLLLTLLYFLYRVVNQHQEVTSRTLKTQAKGKLVNPVWAAGLAFLIYALDNSHAFTVAWIANRNSIIATSFGIMALLSHTHYVQHGWKLGKTLGPLSLLLGLLSAEFAIATTAYLFAWSLFLAPKDNSFSAKFSALLKLWPYALVTLAWLLTYKSLGFGASGNDGYYLDPTENPIKFIGAVWERFPILMFSQFGIIPAEVYSPSLPYAESLRLLALAYLGILALVFRSFFKNNPTAKFWLLGLSLSALPICATGPSDRLLLFVSVGGSGLLGALLYQAINSADWMQQSLSRVKKFFTGLLIFLHLIISPLAVPAFAYSPQVMLGQFQNNIESIEPSWVANKELLIFKSPIMISAYFIPVRFVADLPLPKSIATLASQGNLTITKVKENKLLVDIDYQGEATDYLSFRDPNKDPLMPGDRVELNEVTIEVTAISKGKVPTQLSLELSATASGKSKSYLTWDQQLGEFKTVPIQEMSVGESIIL